MGWTTPRTWATGELVTAVLLNEQMRDNESYVHSGKPLVKVVRNSGSTYSTTSGTFADIDTSNLTATLSVTTGRVLLSFVGCFYASASSKMLGLDFTVDGTRIGGSNGITQENLDTNARSISLLLPYSGLSVGSHTFRVQWNVAAGGTAFLFASSTAPAWFSAWEL